MDSDPRIDTEDPRFDYSQYKDALPSDENLQNVKNMLVKSATGPMWARMLTLVTAIGYAILMWMISKKMDLQRLMERQSYEIERAHKKKDQIKDDDVGNRTRTDRDRSTTS